MTPLRILVILLASAVAMPAAEPLPLAKRRAVPVTIEQGENGRWRLLRDGWPYFVKGACVWGENVRMDDLKNAGANSVRTYHSKYARWTLDAALSRGMTVMLGWEINNEHSGFSYLNESHKARQREAFLAYVRKYKDHPALLAWAVGNEVEQGVDNPGHLEAMWRELNHIAKQTKKIDPNHPTAIVLAGATPEKLAAVRQWCPDVDLVCFNTYKGLRDFPAFLNKEGWEKPYLITEFGAIGWWETPLTSWGAPIEITSTQKAREYLVSYQRGILGDRKRCLGSYVFFWEPKQEATATWFGMFLPGGERLEMIDAMTQAWSGRRPRNRSPQIKTLEFASNKDRYTPGEIVKVKLAASDPEKRQLGVGWKIYEEAPAFTPGNAYEIVPRGLRDQFITPTEDGGAAFAAPMQAGAYRIFVFVYDGGGNAATGNLCFYVESTPEADPAPPPLEAAPPVVSPTPP